MKDRIKYFDIAKGLAMLCIIIGHLGIIRLNAFVFTFHVPLFFLISGYFLSDKLSWDVFTRNKCKQLIVPYVITCCFIIIGITIRDIILTHSTETFVENIRTWTIASIYGSGSIEYTVPFYMKQIGALWFLLALFVSMIIVRFFMDHSWGFIAIVIIAYVGYKTTDFIWLPFSIQAGMLASLFVYIGYLSKKYKVFEKIWNPFILSVMAGIWLICIIFCGQFYMVRNFLGNGLLDIVGALCGSYLVVQCAKGIEHSTKYLSKVLMFYGNNSLVMMCCHAFEMNVISWGWVWKFGEKFKLEYFTTVCILVLAKIVFCTLGILVVQQAKKIFNLLSKKVFEARERLAALSLWHKRTVSSDRVLYWDIAKGVTIILMILGHTGLPDYLRIIIFSFHMPLFIIVNGYFVKSYNIKRTFKRSVKTLLYPYCVTCLLSAVIFMLSASNGRFEISLFLEKVKTMIGGISFSSTKFQSFGSVWLVWFVCCLFITRNLYVIMMKLLEKHAQELRIGAVLIMSILGYCIGKYYAFMPWSLDVAMVSLIFIAFGDWMRKVDFMQKGYFFTLVLPGAVWVYFLYMGIHIELATRSYPYGVFSIIEAIAGSLVVISISKLLEKRKWITKFLSWAGRNSMIILAVHCLEAVYINWNEWVYAYLPFTMNWFRVFIVKSIFILSVTFFVCIGKAGLRNIVQKITNEKVSAQM